MLTDRLLFFFFPPFFIFLFSSLFSVCVCIDFLPLSCKLVD
uniref:Uncharacterized protein n=1 Tax=Rhizophora mucronata TaxID=61149 RepID=A0A2P2LE08_RHIMU